MWQEALRRDTFAGNWSPDNPVSVEDLARAGLYYTGPGDRVKCAFCHKTLHLWAKGDQPEAEHRKYFPECPFVVDPEATGNLPLGDEDKTIINIATNTGRLHIEVCDIKYTLSLYINRL